MITALVRTTGKETVGNDSTGAEVVTASALVEDVDDVVVSGGGAETSAEVIVEVVVTVLLAMVLVSVRMEVEYDVVVGSGPAPPPSRAASDARGKDSRTEASRTRIFAQVRRCCAQLQGRLPTSPASESFGDLRERCDM